VSITQEQADYSARLAQWTGEHWSAVRGFVLALVFRDDVADDLAQETFRRAMESADRYTETGRARSYLLKIADRLVIDHVRRGQRETTIDEASWSHVAVADVDSDPARRIAQREARQQLNEALATLSADQRRVLLLRYYSDMKFSEIAETMQCPLNTVLSHCRRGLLAMREKLIE